MSGLEAAELGATVIREALSRAPQHPRRHPAEHDGALGEPSMLVGPPGDRLGRPRAPAAPRRSDDTIMIAGKRVGPAEVESVLVGHGAVAEAAAVGVPHELKGEAIWCFVVLTRDGDDLEQELRTFVGDGLGKPSHRTGSSPSRPSLARGTGRSSGARSALRSPERAPATSARSRTPRRWQRSRRVQP